MCSFRDRLDHVLNCCIPSLHILLFLHDVLHNESRKFIRIGRQGAIWILPSSVRDNIIIPPSLRPNLRCDEQSLNIQCTLTTMFHTLGKVSDSQSFSRLSLPFSFKIWNMIHSAFQKVYRQYHFNVYTDHGTRSVHTLFDVFSLLLPTEVNALFSPSSPLSCRLFPRSIIFIVSSLAGGGFGFVVVVVAGLQFSLAVFDIVRNGRPLYPPCFRSEKN